MSKSKTKPNGLPIINEFAAGIDIGSRFHVVAVGSDLCDEPVRTFQAFTSDLLRMADWLIEIGIQTVAMESTGVYWVAAYEILESRGINVILANAREARAVPGRKSDVSDAQWLQRLHACGLLRASFRPGREIAALRAYLRSRERHLDYAASHIQHMQKALTFMNLIVSGGIPVICAAAHNLELLRRTRAHVPAGARLLLADFWTDVTHKQPLFAALMAAEFFGLQGKAMSIVRGERLAPREWVAGRGAQILGGTSKSACG